MRTRFLLTGLAALSLGALLSCPVQGKGRQSAERILTDPVSGCRVRDPDPSRGKSVRWSGACRNGYAHGAGVLETFYGAESADWTEADWTEADWTEADFIDGRAEGPGRRGSADGTIFQGRFRHGLATGPGTLTLPDGHRYVGGFAFGRPTGQGEFIASMGLRYRAQVDRDGRVWPGALLGAKPSEPFQSAERPEPKGRAAPGSLEEWLRTPPWDYRDPASSNPASSDPAPGDANRR